MTSPESHLEIEHAIDLSDEDLDLHVTLDEIEEIEDLRAYSIPLAQEQTFQANRRFKYGRGKK